MRLRLLAFLLLIAAAVGGGYYWHAYLRPAADGGFVATFEDITERWGVGGGGGGAAPGGRGGWLRRAGRGGEGGGRAAHPVDPDGRLDPLQ